MTTYKAPLRDMQFVMRDLLNFERHYQSLPACEEVNQELIDAILGEASKFSEEVVAPLNAVGDEQGCRMLDDGETGGVGHAANVAARRARRIGSAI